MEEKKIHLFQARFAISLLKESRKRRIDTNIETCGNISWTVLEKAANYLNSVYYDLKIMDTEKHKAFTGFDNNLLCESIDFSKMKPQALNEVVADLDRHDVIKTVITGRDCETT